MFRFYSLFVFMEYVAHHIAKILVHITSTATMTTDEAVALQHPLVESCDNLLALIESALADEHQGDVINTQAVDSDTTRRRFDDNLSNSSLELERLSDALQRTIQSEESKLTALKAGLEKHEEIHRVSARLDGKKPVAVDGKGGIDVAWFQQENARLRMELDLVTDVIDRQRYDHPKEEKTLHKLLQQLIDRRLQSPDDPFVDPTQIDGVTPKDVQILQEANMIIACPDTDLICLIDYAAGVAVDSVDSQK
jgi:hypothetical protein